MVVTVGRQTMIRAVNRDLAGLPPAARTSALAELARTLAREFDDGDRKIIGELRRTLAELLRPPRVKPPSGPTPADGSPGEEVAERDDLDAIKAERAVRRDELARRRSRRAGAAVHDGAEPRSAAGGDGGC